VLTTHPCEPAACATQDWCSTGGYGTLLSQQEAAALLLSSPLLQKHDGCQPVKSNAPKLNWRKTHNVISLIDSFKLTTLAVAVDVRMRQQNRQLCCWSHLPTDWISEIGSFGWASSLRCSHGARGAENRAAAVKIGTEVLPPPQATPISICFVYLTSLVNCRRPQVRMEV
jgi:hypothetical protein